MSNSDFSFTFEISSFIRADSARVNDALANAKSIGFDVNKDGELTAGGGWASQYYVPAL